METVSRNVPLTEEGYRKMAEKTGVLLPYDEDLSRLAESYRISGAVSAPNRVVYQAMEGCDGSELGAPGELTRRRYLRFARGGAGIIWYEATAIVPEGRANPHQLAMNERVIGEHAALCAEMRRVCREENGYEPIILMQLTHSGRYSKPNGYPEPLIAYHNALYEKDKPIDDSRILSDGYLDSLVEQYAIAARMAERAGFDGVDIKCCHRYLLSELLSAYSRLGKHGGSLENRSRLFRSAVAEVAGATGENFLVTSRMNLYDGLAYPLGFGAKRDGGEGPDLAEAVELAKGLQSSGVRFLNCTMGNPYFNPHVNRPYAMGGYVSPEHPLKGVERMLSGIRDFKQGLDDDFGVISSGLSYLGAASAAVASGCIRDGWFDFAGFGRETLAYPDLARDIVKEGKLNPKKLCIACSKCTAIMRQPGGTPGCVIRDSETYLPIYREKVEENYVKPDTV